MTTRTIVKTPRKVKDWAIYRNALDLGATTSQVTADLLSLYETDVLADTRAVTVMRIIGHVRLYQAAAASTPAWDTLLCGICWSPETSGGPEPFASGQREARWLQQGVIGGVESSSSVIDHQGPASDPNGGDFSIWKFDITQMAKQPTPDHDLNLRIVPLYETFESATMGVEIVTATMIALP